MIRSHIDNQKITPKKKAQEIYADKILETREFWQESLSNIGMINELTAGELEQIQDQMDKIGNRILKLLRQGMELGEYK